MLIVFCLLVVAVGVVLRAWLLGHLVLTSDQAVAGLMAVHIDAGHFSTFYWGQQYGGVEPYVTAALFEVFGRSPTTLDLTPAVLDLAAAVALGWAAWELTDDVGLAGVCGVLGFVWPYAVVWNSVREGGFRFAVLVCGLVLLACALRVYRGRRGPLTLVVLGLAAGVGWWASPEIAYFALPAAIVLLGSRSPSPRPERAWLRAAGQVAVVVAAAVVGALPWIYTNAHTGFASLRSSSLGAPTGSTYGRRLEVFFRDVLPMQLGFRTVPDGSWIGGHSVGEALFGVTVTVVVLAVLWALAAVRRGRPGVPLFALGCALVAFPFLAALVPTSEFWTDGHYGIFLPSLVILLGAGALGGTRRAARAGAGGRHRRRRARWWAAWSTLLVGAGAVVCASALTVVDGHSAGGVPVGPSAVTGAWANPNGATTHVVAEMASHGIRDAYAAYWVAYVLDFEADGRVDVSPSRFDVDRWPALAAAVGASAHPAWLFFAPGRRRTDTAVFLNSEPGPGGYTQADVTGLLTCIGVGYQVVPVGLLDAVVPAKKVQLPPIGTPTPACQT